MIRPGLEPTICRSQCEHANNYPFGISNLFSYVIEKLKGIFKRKEESLRYQRGNKKSLPKNRRTNITMVWIKRTPPHPQHWSTKNYSSSKRLNSTTPVLKAWSKHQYNRNGNTSEYCSINGQNISTTGMAILVSTAPLVDRTSAQQEW